MHFLKEDYAVAKLYKGIIWNGHTELFALLDPDDQIIEMCFRVCLEYRYIGDDEGRFCANDGLDKSCKYLMTNYKSIWEKIKNNKKQKI
jgi:hypothetical protein